jgi:hypothetical protein
VRLSEDSSQVRDDEANPKDARREFEFARSLRKYKDHAEIVHRLESGRSISCIQLDDGKLMSRVHTKRNESLLLFEMVPNDRAGKTYDATWHCPFSLCTTGVSFQTKHELKRKTKSYVMLLTNQSQIHQDRLQRQRARPVPQRATRRRRSSNAQHVHEMYYAIRIDHLERQQNLTSTNQALYCLPKVPGVTYN